MNFEYLKKHSDLNKLYSYCLDAEDLVFSKPSMSAISSRKAMEYIVKMLYSTAVGELYGMTVFDLLDDYRFKEYVNDPILMNTIHYIRKMGNVAAHESNLTKQESLKVLEQLHFLVGEFCINMGIVDDYPNFEEPSVSVPKPTPVKDEDVQNNVKVVEVEPELVAKYSKRMRATKFDVRKDRDEEENKKLYMSACLREADWPIVSLPNQAMPASAGINMIIDNGDVVDYVLYGKDNKPLAIVEYSSTTKNLIEGRMKGIQKADQLAIKYGYKPVVYYTNGYFIYVIDQLGYKPRRVFQFHSMEELELLKQRATSRLDITNPTIDDNITNREYQKNAIKATCNAFANNRRSSLLVMATGTGKTRVSISLVDILMKANWVKNVLFLADRTSLVRQAHKNFNKLLPSVTTSIYAGGSMQKDPNARVIFSTYQTMINLINDDTREFSVGRFDLIIIDEAHRSIFNKYGALFDYFDALMIGLTATPRTEDNKSTYDVFELPNGHPDFAYELEEAIQDGFLVGFNVLDKTTDTLRRGIHYDDLTDEEKRKFEDTFASGDLDGKVIGDHVDYSGTVLSGQTIKRTNYINLGTLDAMLNDLMKNGLKINAGDKLGKTIIFASSHLEAQCIVERFQLLYPYLGLDFCKVIDSKIVNSLGLIDNFEVRDNMPQIAVSVDMLDTGIDVPDILNLVFFKGVSSKIKFLQMIGRGTRLSPDVFGPGMDKQGFLIFDYYDNFNYFSTHNTWSTVDDSTVNKSYTITPQSVLINQKKLNILMALQGKDSVTKFEADYRDRLKNEFISKVRGLCNDDIEVQYNMSYVSKYRTAEQWDLLSGVKYYEINEKIIPLLPPSTDPAKVKAFDLMIYVIEDEVPKRAKEDKDIRKIRHGFGNVGNKISKMLDELTKLKTIPAIVKKEALIKKVRNLDTLFDEFSYANCEYVREELRDLMAYIPDDKKYYIIDAKDFVIDSDGAGGSITKQKTYPEKAQEYITKGDPALAKIRNLDELTAEEKANLNDVFMNKLGSPADYAAWSNNAPLLPFLRLQVGISDYAIKTKFGSFLNADVLNSQQLTYMEQIISYARENGDITFMDLQKESPFSDIDVMALFGANIAHIKALINGLHKPVM